MANNLREFIDYLNEQVTNHSIYVWGAQGQQGSSITEKWIKSRETDTNNYNRAVMFWKKQVAAGYGEVLRAFDCSGLGMFFLQNTKHILSYDHNAHGLYGKCKKIKKEELRVGDFVFKLNSSGRATHIGYVVDDDFHVIEAKGRDYGVIKTLLAKSWNGYGRPPFWTESEVAELANKPATEPTTPAEPITKDEDMGFLFTRNLKHGCRGEDVCELKKLLLAAGFGGLTLTNRNFYATTKKVVKAFQRAKGLKVDGIAGVNTITALGGRWKT